jgi:hypothetical protein
MILARRSAVEIDVNWRFTKMKLEHQEERVRNRNRRFNVCIAFVLASAFSLQAQSDRINVGTPNHVQLQPVLTAKVEESPSIGNASNGSDLPDAPSATKPDASTADPGAPPAVKRDASQGAPPAAMGGPLWVDRSVADRNYLLLTGGMFGATIANTELTLRCLNKHPSCNDVPTSFRSRVDLYGVGIPAELGIAYLTFYMKRKHNHIWYVPAAAVTGANLFLAVRAYRWTQQ